MKTILKLTLLFFVLPFFINCSSSDEGEGAGTTAEFSLKAAIHETCTTEITFRDLDDNVYAYRADDLFFGIPAVQAGGHSDADELTDLGVNVFPDLETLDTGVFSITAGSTLPGTAYVYYFPGDGTQYISTADNTENLVVTIVEYNENGILTKLKGTFSNVEVANILDPDDKLCINDFELVFTI